MWFDLLILAILLFTTIRGAIKGVVWQLAAIASLVLCFVFAQSGSTIISPMIPLKAPANRWVAMFVIYLISSLVAFGAARMLREAIEKAKFTAYDQHLGAILGFAKGAVISLVLIFFTVTLSDSLREPVMKTYSGSAAAIVVDRLHAVLPDELLVQLEPYIHKLDRPDLDLNHRDHDPIGRDGDLGYAGDDPFNRTEPRDPFDRRDPGYRPPDRRDETRDRDNPFDDSLPPRREERRELDRNDDPYANTPTRTREEPGFFDSTPDRSTDRDRRSEPNEIDIIGDLKRKLSGVLEEEVEARVRRAFRNTAPEDRNELTDRLSRALPSMIETIADEWQDGKPSGSTRRPLERDSGESRPSNRQERDRLLAEIVDFYSDTASGKRTARDDFEEHLAGVPERVTVAVLKDWHHDLSSLDRNDDPDPETHHNTLLDQRILRQLRAARVPVSSLEESLQERLRDSERR